MRIAKCKVAISIDSSNSSLEEILENQVDYDSDLSFDEPNQSKHPIELQ